MSLTKIKTFFEKCWDFLKTEAPKAATWEKAAATALNVTAPLLDELVGLTAGEAAETVVSNVIAQVKKDMADASAVLAGSGGSGATLTTALGSIQSNLSTLLTDADVKNATKFSEIESTANTIIGEIEAVASSMPSGYTPPAAPAAANSSTSESVTATAAASDAPHAPATASLTSSK